MRHRNRRRRHLGAALLCCGLFCGPPGGHPLRADQLPTEPGGWLFASRAPLEIGLRFAFEELCGPGERRECDDLPATLSYTSESGAEHRLRIRIRSRTLTREASVTSVLPAAFLLIPPDEAAGTLFAGHPELPFTSHCAGNRDRTKEYALTEYLAYRLYELVAPKSLRARLAAVAFHTAGSRRPIRCSGFFTEHFAVAARRLQAECCADGRPDLATTDPIEMATLAVFQFLIGNLDWSVVHAHNIALFRGADGTFSPVPYDFDSSGLVDAGYASPPPQLGLRSVRSRLYRGFCWPGLDWDAVFQTFRDRRQAVFSLVEEVPDLGRLERRRVGRYLEGFYRVLDDPERRRERIESACRDLPATE